MADPLTQGILLGTGVAIGGGTSAAAAIQQNRAIERTQDSVRRRQRVQQQQQVNQAETLRQQRLRQARLIEGAIRVSESARGAQGSLDPALRQVTFDRARALQTIERNERDALRALNISSEASIDAARARQRNVFLDLFAGSAGGFVTGLNIIQAAPVIGGIFGGSVQGAGPAITELRGATDIPGPIFQGQGVA